MKQKSTQKLPSGRGRRKRKMTPETLQAYKEKRMEKNRLHAKENREKKKHVAKLESEVSYILYHRMHLLRKSWKHVRRN
jgi:hypothetical protein